MARLKVIKIKVTPDSWRMVNQPQLSVFTNVTRYIPAFLCHGFSTPLSCLNENNLPFNYQLRTKVLKTRITASSNQEPEELSSDRKTRWRHWTLRTIVLISSNRIRGTGPILEGTNPPIPFVVAKMPSPLGWWDIPVCWLIIECSTSQSPLW